jgi:hypothetical protein
MANGRDLLFCNAEGVARRSEPKVKDWIVEHRVSADRS